VEFQEKVELLKDTEKAVYGNPEIGRRIVRF